jgi:3-phosphoshikimate 1-carboxyvinyltransferase
MIIRVNPSRLSGTIEAPSSKSLSQRFIAASLLAASPSKLFGLSDCDDCTSALQMAAGLGAEIELGSDAILITPTSNGIPAPRTDELNAGESGLGLRLFTPIAALSPLDITVTGKGTLLNRDQTTLINALSSLGSKATCENNLPPINLKGHIKGGTIEIDGSTGSQFISGLLLALPYAEEDSIVTVHNLVSRPYMEMTLETMDTFSLDYKHEEKENLDVFHIPANQSGDGGEFSIDGDWSAASVLLVLGALCGRPELEVTGIRGDFTQADSGIKGSLLFAGYHILGTDDGLSISKKKPRGFSLDLTNSPDLFPPLAALAAFAKKPSKLKGISRLIGKESNRAEVIKSEFAKAGIKVELNDDTMTITPSKIKPCRIDTHGDHRIAMAAAILGCAGAPIEIENAECVAKSYPAFFDDIASIGADTSEVKS